MTEPMKTTAGQLPVGKIPNGEITLSTMHQADLRNLIQTGESGWLEFKKRVPGAEKMAREIAAFANTKGGTILVGVDDNGVVRGIRSYFEEEFVLFQAAHEMCVPEVPVGIEIVHTSAGDVIVVKVPEMPSKPVYVKGETKRRVYVRRGDESVLASDELTEVLKQKHAEAGVTFEYGENEQMLFRYLNEYGEITVQKYADLINQTTYRAGKILVTLVSAGILTLFTKGPTDYYAFSKQV